MKGIRLVTHACYIGWGGDGRPVGKEGRKEGMDESKGLIEEQRRTGRDKDRAQSEKLGRVEEESA